MQVTGTLLLPFPALEEPLLALLPWKSLGSYWHTEGSEEACSRPAVLKLAIAGNRVVAEGRGVAT